MSDLIPGVTAITMVKDDADRLRRAIASVRDAVDHIIVMDTGSSDGSEKVAAEFGAESFQIEWPGMFDVALNHLLERVRTEFTFRLDSDEWLISGADSIRAAISEPNLQLGLVTRRDLLPGGQHVEGHHVRLWSNRFQPRYIGCVHEQIAPDIERKMMSVGECYETAITLLHDGYEDGSIPQRNRRNLELIRKELDIRPGNIYYEACEVDALISLQDEEATEALRAFVDRMIRSPRDYAQPICAAVLQKGIDDAIAHDPRSPRSGKIIKTALQLFSNVPDVLWAVYRLEATRENWVTALDYALRLVQMGETGRYDRRLSVNPVSMGLLPCREIVRIAGGLGRTELLAQYQPKLRHYELEMERQGVRLES